MAGATAQSPLELAILEVRADLKRKDYVKNEFYKTLLNDDPPVDPTAQDGGASQSQVCADKLRQHIKGLESSLRGRHDYRILSRVGPFIDTFQMMMQNCEKLFQAAPFGVSVAFSGVHLLLRIASSIDTYLETILDAIEQIGNIIVCYEKFSAAYSDTEVQRCLLSSYKRILLFWGAASQTLAQHDHRSTVKLVFKSISKPLNRQIKDALDGIEKDAQAVQRLAYATEAEQKLKERAEMRRQAILDWILGKGSTDTALQLQSQLDRQQNGTCTWILDDTRFQEWHDSKHNATLWYNAPPGSGKSVLSASVARHLIDEGKDVAYYFYSFSDPWRRQGLNGLRSLALQLVLLLEKNGQPIPDKVASIYDTAIKERVKTMKTLASATEIVHELINLCPHIYVIVDGLDECSEEDEMVSMVDLLLGTRSLGLAKWFFTSRSDHPRIRAVMQKHRCASITPDFSHLSSDIQLYFSARVTIDCKKCVKRWVRDFNTSFLYASLICDILQGKNFTCQEEIDQALREFPPELNNYYIQLLERLVTKPEPKQELAR